MLVLGRLLCLFANKHVWFYMALEPWTSHSHDFCFFTSLCGKGKGVPGWQPFSGNLRTDFHGMVSMQAYHPGERLLSPSLAIVVCSERMKGRICFHQAFLAGSNVNMLACSFQVGCSRIE